MKIENIIRNNVALNAHPSGLKKYVDDQIAYIKTKQTFDGPKKVLIIGGSSGYGLSTRIALTYGCDAKTINVSYESAPKAKRTGTAGWYNNLYFQEEAKKDNKECKDFIGDAFSKEMKEEVIKYLKANNEQIDLLVYSIASGRRTDPIDGNTYISSLKSTTTPIKGLSIDFSNGNLFEQTMDIAKEEEIQNTIKVMGGEDWLMWIDDLQKEGLLANNFKTISYTYLGPKLTHDIYMNGTIGHAKRHLEETCKTINKHISYLNGEALISSSKAIVSKASAYIPIFPVYGAILYKVMKEHNLHETPIEHKYRLFKDMVYGNKREIDDNGILRPDSWENKEFIQNKVETLMMKVNNDTFEVLADKKGFINEFYQLSGFGYDTIDYEQDIDLEIFQNKVIY